jgi:hypothetical protein
VDNLLIAVVYNLSLLSSLPQSLLPLLPTEALPPLRPRPLFTVGIHDIPFLSSFANSSTSTPGVEPCWIACTTDHVLAIKPDLYDILVTLPPQSSKKAAEKKYPKISLSSPQPFKSKSTTTSEPLKATQRDVRRYITLRDGLREFSRTDSAPEPESEDEMDAASTFSSSPIVEPLSWPFVAYTSFIWWASAGEKRSIAPEDEEEESEQDARLLQTEIENSPYMPASGSAPRRPSVVAMEEPSQQQPREITLIAYFRRLTTQIFTTLADAIARQDEDDYEDNTSNDGGDGASSGHYCDEPDDENITTTEDDPNAPLLQSSIRHTNTDDDPALIITTADMAQMGLDVWSVTDQAFIEELVAVWWGRKARVQGARIKCCGVPVL